MDQSWNRLVSCMEKARRGEELTIGFLGGSITQGSLASDEKKTYAYRVYQWWCETFPQSRFSYVNGGIGGTCSCFGAARAVKDLLMYQPDMVVVDFSVNDKEEEFYQETFEGVVRKILGWASSPALVILNNVFYNSGKNAQYLHNAVAVYYQVPYVSIRDSIYQDMVNGKYQQEELTPDGLHPNDTGHMLVAGEIIKFLEKVRAAFVKCGEKSCGEGNLEEKEQAEEGKVLPSPLTRNRYEQAKLLTIQNSCPVLLGFHADTREKKGHLDVFRNGWIGRAKGDKISFEVECSCIAVQYRKTVNKSSPTAKLVLDRRQDEEMILDGNFEETWGDCLYLQPVFSDEKTGRHCVEIEIIRAGEEGVENTSPFYLLSLIIS